MFHQNVHSHSIGGYGEWSMDVEWLLEEAARSAARRDWSRMGLPLAKMFNILRQISMSFVFIF